MQDPLSIARDRLGKAEAKVLRLEKQLESARSERDDLQTTVRVMAEITGEASAQEPTPVQSGRQRQILAMLPETQEKGISPASLFETYELIGGDDITLDTFRTTIWRMKGIAYAMPNDGGAYIVRAGDGKYWKDRIGDKEEAPDAEASGASEIMGLASSGGSVSHPASEGSSPSRSTPVQAAYDGDLDDDVPF